MVKGITFSVPHGRHSSLTYCRMSKVLPWTQRPGDVNMLQVAFTWATPARKPRAWISHMFETQELCKSWLTRHTIRQREACPLLPEPNHNGTCFHVHSPLQLAKLKQGQPPKPTTISSLNSILISSLFLKISPFHTEYQQSTTCFYCSLFQG